MTSHIVPGIDLDASMIEDPIGQEITKLIMNEGSITFTQLLEQLSMNISAPELIKATRDLIENRQLMSHPIDPKNSQPETEFEDLPSD
ncbi:MAG: hypothetical protein ACXAC2_18805 [Candidatus Kariarchaeaceae archaeon]|jgi:hypothetical protein